MTHHFNFPSLSISRLMITALSQHHRVSGIELGIGLALPTSSSSGRAKGAPLSISVK